jgi:hypothetical protein
MISVLYLDIRGGGGVIKAGSDEASLLDPLSLLWFRTSICFVILNQSILLNTTFRLSSISPAFLKALLYNFIVKVLLENY